MDCYKMKWNPKNCLAKIYNCRLSKMIVVIKHEFLFMLGVPCVFFHLVFIPML